MIIGVSFDPGLSCSAVALWDQNHKLVRTQRIFPRAGNAVHKCHTVREWCMEVFTGIPITEPVTCVVEEPHHWTPKQCLDSLFKNAGAAYVIAECALSHGMEVVMIHKSRTTKTEAAIVVHRVAVHLDYGLNEHEIDAVYIGLLGGLGA